MHRNLRARPYPRLDGIAARQRRAIVVDLVIWALLGLGALVSLLAV